MRWLPILLIAFSLTPAHADAYSDFSRGIDANNRGEPETAAAAFTQALAPGNLAPSYVATAYLGRAKAYLGLQQCAAAYADLNQAIRLRPDYADAYLLRATADECLGQVNAALHDVSVAISYRPAAGYIFERALILWDAGNFRDAAADANAAAEREPGNPYFLLWTALSGARTGAFDRGTFEKRASALASGRWPAPLLALYLGRATEADIYRGASMGYGRRPANQKCEADFYIGEWHILRGEPASAKGAIQLAASQCPRNYLAWRAANAELKRLERIRTASTR